MTTHALTVPEIEPLERNHAGLMVDARSLTEIATPERYTLAGIIKRNLSARRLFIVEFFKPMKAAAKVAHETICNRERTVLTPVQDEEWRIGRLLVGYDDAQEHQRQLAQRQAEEEAQLAEAEQHEALGDHQAADAALNGQGLVQINVPTATPKVEGLSYREHWSAEVTDKLALIKAVAEGKAPLAYVEPNYPVLNQAARSIKQELNSIAGVKAVMTKTAVGRR